jgi:hypothetical protein
MIPMNVKPSIPRIFILFISRLILIGGYFTITTLIRADVLNAPYKDICVYYGVRDSVCYSKELTEYHRRIWIFAIRIFWILAFSIGIPQIYSLTEKHKSFKSGIAWILFSLLILYVVIIRMIFRQNFVSYSPFGNLIFIRNAFTWKCEPNSEITSQWYHISPEDVGLYKITMCPQINNLKLFP